LNKTTHKLLGHFAKQINRPDQPPVKERLTLTPKRFEYYFQLSIKERVIVHEELQTLFDKNGCADIKYGPVALGEVAQIEAVEIIEPYDFLKLSGDHCLYDLIENACKELSKLNVVCGWLHGVVEKAIAYWRGGVQAYGVKPNEVNRLIDSLKLLDWLEENGEEAVPDMRTLSVKLFQDSKRLELITGTIARIYEFQLPGHLAGSSTDQMIDYLGISKFAPMIRLKGGFEVLLLTGVIDCSNVQPYLGFPPDAIIGIRANHSPAYILFIENATTFNRYTREIQDNGWVIYTNGFPSRSWSSIFRVLVFQAGSSVPVYHWGDIDVGGYRILMHLQAILEIDLRPFRMLPEADSVARSGSKMIPIKALRSVIADATSPSMKALDVSLKAIEENSDSVPWVEQEQLDLKAPIEPSEFSNN
jgi:hypothetical protein